MDRFLKITKRPVSAADDKRDKDAAKKMTKQEHIMHIATTSSTSGHDIWQSASTGHQVSEAGGKSVSYNEARLAKLQAQFPAQRKPKLTKCDDAQGSDSSHIPLFEYDASSNLYHPSPVTSTPRTESSGIFSGCVFYLDGYMGPKMSDHTLRRKLTQNGGTLSMYLKKTRITHVLLSDGGALANSKIRKEVEGRRNRVKFVRVDWVHQCLEQGRRLSEWEFSIDRLCGRNKSVATMLSHRPLIPADDEIVELPSQQGGTPVLDLDTEPLDQTEDILGAEEGERYDALDR